MSVGEERGWELICADSCRYALPLAGLSRSSRASIWASLASWLALVGVVEGMGEGVETASGVLSGSRTQSAVGVLLGRL